MSSFCKTNRYAYVFFSVSEDKKREKNMLHIVSSILACVRTVLMIQYAVQSFSVFLGISIVLSDPSFPHISHSRIHGPAKARSAGKCWQKKKIKKIGESQKVCCRMLMVANANGGSMVITADLILISTQQLWGIELKHQIFPY